MEEILTTPNEITIGAMLEAEQITYNPSIEGYDNVDALFEDLDKQ